MKHLFPLFFWEEINAFFLPFSFKAQLSSSLRAKICFCFFLPSLATRRKVNTGKTRSIYSTPRARVQLQFTRVLGGKEDIFIICCPSFSTLENVPIFHSAQMVDTTLSRWRTGYFTAPGKQHSATHPLMQGTVQTRTYTHTHIPKGRGKILLIPYQSRDRRVDFCDGFAFVFVSFFSFSFFFRSRLAFSFYCKTGATFKITRVNSFLVVCAVLSHPFRTPSPHRHCVSLLRNALPTLTHSSHSLFPSRSLPSLSIHSLCCGAVLALA